MYVWLLALGPLPLAPWAHHSGAFVTEGVSHRYLRETARRIWEVPCAVGRLHRHSFETAIHQGNGALTGRSEFRCFRRRPMYGRDRAPQVAAIRVRHVN